MSKKNMANVRRAMLQRRGVVLEPHTRKPLEYHEAEASFTKTPLMRFVELKFGKPVEVLVATGTIYALAKQLSLDATTVSKWRKRIRESGTIVEVKKK